MELIQDFKQIGVNRMQFAITEQNTKKIWEDKIRRAKNLYPQLEYLTVQHDLRNSMILHGVTHDIYDSYARFFAKLGLVMVPMIREGIITDQFYHKAQQYVDGSPYSFRCVITKKTSDAEELIDATIKGNQKKIGKLLGYPDCCCSFFEENWKQGYVDPLWQQALKSENIRYFDKPDEKYGVDKKIIRIKSGNHEISSYLRYIGVRILSHIPCSLNCAKSIEIAKDWIRLARDLNLEGVDENIEILSLPVEWDCLKGISIINTPAFKIVTDSNPSKYQHVVQKESDYYPDELPSGAKFPWKNPLFR